MFQIWVKIWDMELVAFFFSVRLQYMPNAVHVSSYVTSQFTVIQTWKNGCVLKLQNVLR